nr:interleukin-4 isoform X1 [Pongo pygmaeus]XP_054411908.1 interleukin-4 isoform X1 [Pongo abelii]
MCRQLCPWTQVRYRLTRDHQNFEQPHRAEDSVHRVDRNGHLCCLQAACMSVHLQTHRHHLPPPTSPCPFHLDLPTKLRENTTEKETFCRAATVLRQFYSHHEKDTRCLGATAQQFHRHKQLIRFLKRLDRNLWGLAGLNSCPVKEANQSTLEDFLERLKTIMREKYSKCSS